VATDLEVAATTAVVTTATVREIGSSVATAPTERAEAQPPQPGSAATVADFTAGMAVAATSKRMAEQAELDSGDAADPKKNVLG
jgi:hypothetical protein